jgi:predicted lipoprotein with Yx(FWY)xxD motif
LPERRLGQREGLRGGGVHWGMTPIHEPKEPHPMHSTSVPVPARLRLRPLAAVLLATALACVAALGTLAAPAFARHSVHVHAARNATLGKRIVVTASGRTLYTLSAEVHGRFICTRSCLGTWHPLKVPAGGKVEGVAHLGVIKRPDGGRQATFNGRPLYTFDGDHRAGQAGGEGFRDVGTWHAAVAPRR